jgi:uncharacterized protein with HEPN domain
MIGFCERVMQYTQGFDANRFADDRLHYDATLRNLELIGRLPAAFPKPSAAPIRRSRGGLSSRRGIA